MHRLRSPADGRAMSPCPRRQRGRFARNAAPGSSHCIFAADASRRLPLTRAPSAVRRFAAFHLTSTQINHAVQDRLACLRRPGRVRLQHGHAVQDGGLARRARRPGRDGQEVGACCSLRRQTNFLLLLPAPLLAYRLAPSCLARSLISPRLPPPTRAGWRPGQGRP